MNITNFKKAISSLSLNLSESFKVEEKDIQIISLKGDKRFLRGIAFVNKKSYRFSYDSKENICNLHLYVPHCLNKLQWTE